METIEEVWVTVPGFQERYVVSNLGRVMNVRSERLIKPQLTPQGITYVPLYSDTGHETRSIKVLVARAFVEGETNIFDTPINVDGIKSNNAASNLMWRPRWFAVKYSRQFLTKSDKEDEGPVYEDAAELRFETVREVALTYGLLFRDVYRSTYSETPVFPTQQIFRIPKAIHVR